MKRTVRTIVAGVMLLAIFVPATAGAAPRREARPSAAALGTSVSRVRIVDFAFRPASITISRGDVVKWKNRGDTTHTTTSSSWDSGRLSPGDAFRHRFRRAGTFSYHCSIHPQMTGTIVVQ
jgi:plastocyanin